MGNGTSSLGKVDKIHEARLVPFFHGLTQILQARQITIKLLIACSASSSPNARAR